LLRPVGQLTALGYDLLHDACHLAAGAGCQAESKVQLPLVQESHDFGCVRKQGHFDLTVEVNRFRMETIDLPQLVSLGRIRETWASGPAS
jgi:hypothetical protein